MRLTEWYKNTIKKVADKIYKAAEIKTTYKSQGNKQTCKCEGGMNAKEQQKRGKKRQTKLHQKEVIIP